jgi:para-aminobenzoate synthetase component 1
MGSMTGAPKIMAMELIEQHEQMKRGLYSGTLGYIDPKNNYDFNVLIRSIIINQVTRKAQFCVGSAITAKANAEDEYQECLLKANALFKVLS